MHCRCNSYYGNIFICENGLRHMKVRYVLKQENFLNKQHPFYRDFLCFSVVMIAYKI
jgi:hypothetical protein